MAESSSSPSGIWKSLYCLSSLFLDIVLQEKSTSLSNIKPNPPVQAGDLSPLVKDGGGKLLRVKLVGLPVVADDLVAPPRLLLEHVGGELAWTSPPLLPWSGQREQGAGDDGVHGLPGHPPPNRSHPASLKTQTPKLDVRHKPRVRCQSGPLLSPSGQFTF